MFAATTCSSVTSPAARREKRLDARQDGVDPRVAALRGRLDRDPVTHRREVGAHAGVMAQTSGDPRQQFAVRGRHPVDVRVFEADPAGNAPLCRVFLEGLGQPRGPAGTAREVRSLR